MSWSLPGSPGFRWPEGRLVRGMSRWGGEGGSGGWSSPEVSCGGGVTGGAFPRVQGLSPGWRGSSINRLVVQKKKKSN